MTVADTVGRRVQDEAGVATIWAAALAALLVGLLVVGVGVASAVVARHRAEAAADLAALAAATHAVRGVRTACDRAQDIATRMGADLTDCRLDGWNALVTTQVRVYLPILGQSRAKGRAHAGPVNGSCHEPLCVRPRPER